MVVLECEDIGGSCMVDEKRKASREVIDQNVERSVRYIINTCRAKRIEKGFSIEDIAAITQIKPSRVRKFEESGHVTVDEALAIADVVCDDVSALLRESDRLREGSVVH